MMKLDEDAPSRWKQENERVLRCEHLPKHEPCIIAKPFTMVHEVKGLNSRKSGLVRID